MAAVENDSWPRWAKETIQLVDYDPAWHAQGAQLIAELEELLAPWLR